MTCAKLSDIHPNKTEIDLGELRDDLYGHFNRSYDYSAARDIYEIRRFEELILNRTKAGGYLILDEMVCLVANYLWDSREIHEFLPVVRSALFIFKKDTFDFIQMKSSDDQIDQLTVLKKGPPYSDCDESNSRFHCLNDCFKSRFRLSRYLYDGNETGLIQLTDYTERNRTIEESERNCFEECKRENCKMVQFILRGPFVRK